MNFTLRTACTLMLLYNSLPPVATSFLSKIDRYFDKYWEVEKLMSSYLICEDISEPNILSYFFKSIYPKGREWLSDLYDKCNGDLRDSVHRCLDKGCIKLVEKCRYGFGTFKAWHFYRPVYRYLPCDDSKIKPEQVIVVEF